MKRAALLLTGMTAAVLAWRRWYLRALTSGVLLGAIFGGGVGWGVGGLHDTLRSPYRFDAARGGPSFYDASGRPLDELTYRTLNSQRAATSILLGVSAGVVVLMLTVWLSQRWYHRRVLSAAQEEGQSAESAGPLNAPA